MFTGNALMVMAAVDRKISARQLLRSWGIVYPGNLAGAAGLAVAFGFSGILHGPFWGVRAGAMRCALLTFDFPCRRSQRAPRPDEGALDAAGERSLPIEISAPGPLQPFSGTSAQFLGPNDQSVMTVDPVVWRLSSARCASTICSSGYVWPILTLMAPLSTLEKRCFAMS